MIGMTSKYYGGSVARGYEADIWAAEVPMDYKAKARKAHRDSTMPGMYGTDLLAPCWPC